MTEISEETPILEEKRPAKPSLWQRIAQNPVVLKELRGRMRGGRTFILLTIYLILASAVVALVFIGFYASSNNVFLGADVRRALGKTVFFSVAGMELVMICFIAPALTAGAISAERERQTYDLLRTTLLSARSLVLGKLFSSLSFLWLLLFTALPLLGLAYLFGGIAIEEVIIALLILFVSSIFFSAMGIFYSSFTRRTLAPTVLAYATTIIIVFGIPILIFMVLAFYTSMFAYPARPFSQFIELLMFTGGWFLITLNPLGTAVVTEMILVNDQSLFSTTITLPNGGNFLVLSPWMFFIVFYSLLSILLVALSVRFVRRVEQ